MPFLPCADSSPLPPATPDFRIGGIHCGAIVCAFSAVTSGLSAATSKLPTATCLSSAGFALGLCGYSGSHTASCFSAGIGSKRDPGWDASRPFVICYPAQPDSRSKSRYPSAGTQAIAKPVLPRGAGSQTNARTDSRRRSFQLGQSTSKASPSAKPSDARPDASAFPRYWRSARFWSLDDFEKSAEGPTRNGPEKSGIDGPQYPARQQSWLGPSGKCSVITRSCARTTYYY